METESLIAKVLGDLCPGWEHRDTGREWQQVLCPFHNEENPSASVSFEHDAFCCFACGVKGDAVGLIRQFKEVSRSEAIEYAEKLLGGSYGEVRRDTKRKPRRRVFGQSAGSSGSPDEVPPGVRGRTPPWS